MAKKFGITFDFLNLDHEEELSLSTMMSFPIQLLKNGLVELGARLALTYKNYFDRVCQAALIKTGATSIGRKDWIRGNHHVVKTDWYKMEFIPTAVGVYFQCLDVDNDHEISFIEWKRLYELRGITDDQFCRSTFDRMDQNGDGAISKEEFEYAFRQFALCENPDNDYSFLYARNSER